MTGEETFEWPPDESPMHIKMPEEYTLEDWKQIVYMRGQELWDATIEIYDLKKEITHLKLMLDLVTPTVDESEGD